LSVLFSLMVISSILLLFIGLSLLKYLKYPKYPNYPKQGC